MSQLGILKDKWWDIKDQPQDGDLDNAHEGQFKTFIKNLERRTFGGHVECRILLFNVSLLCFVQIFMLHVDRKALRDSVGMDKFHQMSNLLVPFVGLPVGRRMIFWLPTVLATPTQWTVSGMSWTPSTDTLALQLCTQTIVTNSDQLPRALLLFLLLASSAVLGL